MVQRRTRQKWRAVVMPSPVGLAMLYDAGPSPLIPRPARHGPFFTKMEQSIALPMRVMLATFMECMMAVWR